MVSVGGEESTGLNSGLDVSPVYLTFTHLAIASVSTKNKANGPFSRDRPSQRAHRGPWRTHGCHCQVIMTVLHGAEINALLAYAVMQSLLRMSPSEGTSPELAARLLL